MTASRPSSLDRVHNQQNGIYIADCVPPVFTFDRAVFTNDDVRITEDQSCLVKSDAVLLDIGMILVFVPFDAYRHPPNSSKYNVVTQTRGLHFCSEELLEQSRTDRLSDCSLANELFTWGRNCGHEQKFRNTQFSRAHMAHPNRSAAPRRPWFALTLAQLYAGPFRTRRSVDE